MWALVTVKGAGPIAEDIGKSVDTASWGSKVTLDATIPLKDSAGVCVCVCVECVVCVCDGRVTRAAYECDWPATAENIRRKAFCSKYEGYGQLCNCAAPIPLTLSPPNVSPHAHTLLTPSRPHTPHAHTLLTPTQSSRPHNPRAHTLITSTHSSRPHTPHAHTILTHSFLQTTWLMFQLQ